MDFFRKLLERFPGDFMFKLTKKEFNSLRSQIVILDGGRGRYRKYLPYVFTQYGILMLSSVLNSERAVQVNIQIMRTFTKLRRMLSTHEDLKRKIEDMVKRYDARFKVAPGHSLLRAGAQT
jgi:phage regulator Rha-like protein